MSREKHSEDGKSLYVWRQDDYQKDPLIEKHLTRNDSGWKIHLNVPADKNDKLTKEVASFLNGHPYVHMYKIGHGGEEEDGKGMTIYVGSWDRVASLAHALHGTFGARLPPAKAWSNIRLVGNVSARFDAPQPAYARYGSSRGLGGLKKFEDYDEFSLSKRPEHERRMICDMTMEQYTNDFGDYIWGHGVTARYQEVIAKRIHEKGNREGILSGRNEAVAMLPDWAQVWHREGDVPFELEAAALPSPPSSKPAANPTARPHKPSFSRGM